VSEQRLNTQYLGSSLIERAFATAVIVLAVGAAFLLVAWGISRFWHVEPPELKVRIANPEVRLAGNPSIAVTQDKPFTVQDKQFTVVQEPTKPDMSIYFPPQEKGGPTATPPARDIIRREVTVFSTVEHTPGRVSTGWKYRDGEGGTPFHQYCYYAEPNFDGSSTRVDIAENGTRLPEVNAALVPGLSGALAKCQWWRS